MANILQSQYASVFSNPNSPDIDPNAENVKPAESEIHSITVTENEMIDAMNELDPYSSAPDGDIPARILKSCRAALCKPLTILWSNSLESGAIPEQLKHQYVAPIFKKGSKTDAANYRPVSLTSHTIKIFERVIRKHLVAYLEMNNLISGKQHGFRKGRSCLTQLLSHIDNILQNHVKGMETDVIYLDYAKAFDKVDHNILLQKLALYGIRGPLLVWLTQFLRNRQQVVVVDGHKSRPEPVISGVPQGTVLGPILFILYMNEIENVLTEARSSSFADDTRMSQAIDTAEDTAKLQNDLNAIVQWSRENNMKLHEDKFELLCYRNKSSALLQALPFSEEYCQYTTPAGFSLYPKELVKDLGVHLSADRSWSPHISTITSNARKMASWVLGVFRDRSKTTMMHLYKSMVRHNVEYCSPVWNPSSISDIQTLEEVQQFFTEKISGLRHVDYWSRLKILKLPSLQRRRERYSIIHIWKILNNLAPNDLGLNFYDHQRHGVKVRIAPIDKKARQSAKTLYDNSFAVNASQLWNVLPRHVNSIDDLEAFKRELGKYLDKFPDTPPCVGMTPANKNSLLDWKQSGVGGLQETWLP